MLPQIAANDNGSNRSGGSTTMLVATGSNRSQGYTRLLVCAAFAESPCRLVDVNSLSFSDHDYVHDNRDEVLPALAGELITHDQIVLATPVYWYSMTTTMKHCGRRRIISIEPGDVTCIGASRAI